MIEAITAWDFSVLFFIQEHFKCAFLDTLMPIITLFGEAGIFWIAVAIALLFTKKYRQCGLMMGAALVLGLIFGNGILKNVIARTRPYDIADVKLLVDALHDYSFPSGHTLACFEASTVLLIKDKRLGIPALIIAIAVAISRLYLFVHYPTDVIVGCILGIVFGICGTLAVKYLYRIISGKISGNKTKQDKENDPVSAEAE